MASITDLTRLLHGLTIIARSPPTPIPNLRTTLLRLTLLQRIRPPPPPPPPSSPIPTPPPTPTPPETPPTTPPPPPPSPPTPNPPSPPIPTPTPPPTTPPLDPTPTLTSAIPSSNPTYPTTPQPSATTATPTTPTTSWTPREQYVPESPISRVVGFGTLGLGLLAGAAAESARRVVGLSAPSNQRSSAFITERNAQRLANSLSRMRGAALKLGQILSIQDENVVPETVLRALERVRQGADVMPAPQLERVMTQELGKNWRERVVEFEESAFAAASIGQVHRGRVLREGGKEVDVVFKVQYPGVGRSIKSDLGNLRRLVVVGGFVPDNFFVDEALKVAEEELERECDYGIERANQERYRELLMGNEVLSQTFYVPEVFGEFCTKHVLVSEFVRGVPIDRVGSMEKAVRDTVAEKLLKLTLSELFLFAFQQSDPNWSNYLYEEETGRINLIDFGAARAYNEKFLMRYLELIRACARRDRQGVIEHSIRLGFLTGEESRDMLNAHVQASFAVGEPFQEQNRERGFNFAGNDIPARTAKFGRVMLNHRLTPPPKEAYSLHRRLSGAFLMSMKLGATINAAKMLEETVAELVREGRIAK